MSHMSGAAVQQIREELVKTRKQLEGGRDAAEWVDAMTKACRRFLDVAEAFDEEAHFEPNFEPALRELREFIRSAAKHFGSDYDLQEARQLVNEMYEEDRGRLEREMQREGATSPTADE